MVEYLLFFFILLCGRKTGPFYCNCSNVYVIFFV